MFDSSGVKVPLTNLMEVKSLRSGGRYARDSLWPVPLNARFRRRPTRKRTDFAAGSDLRNFAVCAMVKRSRSRRRMAVRLHSESVAMAFCIRSTRSRCLSCSKGDGVRSRHSMAGDSGTGTWNCATRLHQLPHREAGTELRVVQALARHAGRVYCQPPPSAL